MLPLSGETGGSFISPEVDGSGGKGGLDDACKATAAPTAPTSATAVAAVAVVDIAALPVVLWPLLDNPCS